MSRSRCIAACAIAGLLLVPSLRATAEEQGAAVIAPGSRVSIEYTLKLEDGTTADSNVGGKPLTYEQGRGQILPALEQALVGMKASDTKAVTLTPDQGYGVVDPKAFETVPVEVIPEEARVAGAQLVAQDPQGKRRPVRVHEVRAEEVTLDLNHPLAGKKLFFDIKIVAVE